MKSAACAHRMAHLPLAGLRAAAVHASPDVVDAFFDAAQPSEPRAQGQEEALEPQPKDET